MTRVTPAAPSARAAGNGESLRWLRVPSPVVGFGRVPCPQAPLPVLARRLPPGEGGHMRLRAAARAGTARASVMGPTPASQPIATNQVG
mmetsp:Transcript_6795/g.17797  ORF Transcript_6795/g.17797 Transcript_6795/m.17797 type:complete len:89 (+) Transcript_6795:78-344(+)